MENSLAELMNSTMTNIESMVRVNNIVGEPIVTPDGVTIIPISKLSFGFGGGGGDRKKDNGANFTGGSAAGVKIEPIGFLVIKDGSVRMVNIAQTESAADRIMDLVPQVLEKVDKFMKD